MAARSAPKKKVVKPKAHDKKGAEKAILARHSHHRAMAEKHRALAALIEAKLATQGKAIAQPGMPMPQGPPQGQPRIVQQGP